MEIGIEFGKMKINSRWLEFCGLFFNEYSIRITRLFFDNGKLCYSYRTSKPGIKSTHTGRVNPFPRWKRRLIWLYRLKSYKQCEGCGVGIAEYRITDPNYLLGSEKKKKRHFNCCSNCVSFYDMGYTRKKIKSWKKGKAVTK